MGYQMPAEAFPPGEFLREELEARGWTQIDLAEILGCHPRTVNEIIAAKRGITTDTAMGLAAALGTSPEFWLRLEQSYQLWRNRGKNTEPVSRRARLYEYAPIKEMTRRGWIPASESVEVLEASVLRFFETESLDEEPAFLCAARKSTSYAEPFTPAQKAWLARSKQLARSLQVGRFSPERAVAAAEALRRLAHEPSEARHVPRLLAEAGIRFVVVAPFPGMKIDGACIWLAKESDPIIALSMRFDRIDNFWFTLLHEVRHVIKCDESIDYELDRPSSDDPRPEWEREADRFAANTLVEAKALEGFIARKRPLYSRRDIEAFAHVQRVHPGIVVGQLHARGELQYANLRQLLVPIRDVVVTAALTDGWGSVVPPIH